MPDFAIHLPEHVNAVRWLKYPIAPAAATRTVDSGRLLRLISHPATTCSCMTPLLTAHPSVWRPVMPDTITVDTNSTVARTIAARRSLTAAMPAAANTISSGRIGAMKR